MRTRRYEADTGDRRFRRWLIGFTVPLAIVVAGCGGGSGDAAPVADDARLISDVVEEFNEARLDLKKTTKLFAVGKVPAKAQFKKFAPNSYWPNVGGPRISGDAASMKVTVRNETTGDDVGVVEWAFVKEAEGWKIQSAPLP